MGQLVQEGLGRGPAPQPGRVDGEGDGGRVEKPPGRGVRRVHLGDQPRGLDAGEPPPAEERAGEPRWAANDWKPGNGLDLVVASLR